MPDHRTPRSNAPIAPLDPLFDPDVELESASVGLVERTVAPEDRGARLDKWLAGQVADLSRSRLKALILEGAVSRAGLAVTDPGAKIAAGETWSIVVPEPESAVPRPEPIPLSIVHEDEDLVVIDKPAGLVVHPAPGHDGGTLVNALLHHCGDSLSGIGGVRRPGIVHRLDKDTSGLLVVAKNDRTHKKLSAQFADHGRTGPLERLYVAVVWGVPQLKRGVIHAAIDRHGHDRERMSVVGAGRGRDAITHYEIQESFAGPSGEPVAALVTCALETGRTHQIRVHMAHLGHPLLGDPLYGTGFRTKAVKLGEGAREALDKLGRQALHAATLGFEHPRTGEIRRFESALPADLTALVEALRAGT